MSFAVKSTNLFYGGKIPKSPSFQAETEISPSGDFFSSAFAQNRPVTTLKGEPFGAMQNDRLVFLWSGFFQWIKLTFRKVSPVSFIGQRKDAVYFLNSKILRKRKILIQILDWKSINDFYSLLLGIDHQPRASICMPTQIDRETSISQQLGIKTKVVPQKCIETYRSWHYLTSLLSNRNIFRSRFGAWKNSSKNLIRAQLTGNAILKPFSCYLWWHRVSSAPPPNGQTVCGLLSKCELLNNLQTSR